MDELAQQLEDGAGQLDVHLNAQQVRQLLAYGALILRWNRVYNLTAVRDAGGVLTHHLLDSLALLAPLRREWPGGGALLDVGAGAGLPGVVIAIARPELQVHCVDAVAKKAAFIQQVSAELGLRNLKGVHARVEALTSTYDLITSRAFASLQDFFSLSARALRPGGIWLAMKGQLPTSEIDALSSAIDVFHVEHLQVPGLGSERCLVWARPGTDVARAGAPLA